MSSAKHFTEVLIGGKVYTLSGFRGRGIFTESIFLSES